MRDEQRFEINSEVYTILENHDYHWYWRHDGQNMESKGTFETGIEALQDAINREHAEVDELACGEERRELTTESWR